MKGQATVGWSRGGGHSRTSSSVCVAARQGANEKQGERQGLQGEPSCSDRCPHQFRLCGPSLPMRLLLPRGQGTSRTHSPPLASHVWVQVALRPEKGGGLKGQPNYLQGKCLHRPSGPFCLCTCPGCSR